MMKDDDYFDDNFTPDGIDAPSDDIYNIHNTNFNRTPYVKSLIPRSPPGKPKTNKAVPPKPRYHGPVYLPKHIYNMLSDDVRKELDKYNRGRRLDTSLVIPELPNPMSKIMMMLITQTTQSLTLRIISQMTHTLTGF